MSDKRLKHFSMSANNLISICIIYELSEVFKYVKI